MKINGYDVLCNEHQWKAWMKRNCLWSSLYGNEKPREFPCLAFERAEYTGDGHAEFIYKSDILLMSGAIEAAHKRPTE